MMPRALRLLLLCLALLFGQLGGALHAYAHHGPDQGQPHAACQLCAAYANLDHAVTGTPPAALSAQDHPAPISRLRTGLPPACTPPYRCRAPPARLV